MIKTQNQNLTIKKFRTMRKLVFGLFLTVGVSGVSFANTSENLSIDKTLDINSFGEQPALNNIEVLLSCFHGYRTITVGCDGAKSSIYLGGHESSCGANEEDGTIFIHVSGPVSTCQSGPLKDFNDAMDWITPLT